MVMLTEQEPVSQSRICANGICLLSCRFSGFCAVIPLSQPFRRDPPAVKKVVLYLLADTLHSLACQLFTTVLICHPVCPLIDKAALLFRRAPQVSPTISWIDS
jgi:hypothetical protein